MSFITSLESQGKPTDPNSNPVSAPNSEITSIPGQIRNVQQSAQYRDVIKQASDLVVFIDGQDYAINPYLGDTGVVVKLNNYVTSWQSSYGIESMIPSGSLTLTVAAPDDHLFRAPGGNKILKTMSDIRVYAKGYYLSPRGNTFYRQIFKGFVSSISYTPTGMQTTITLSCFGALGMLERMQVEQNPSTMSSSPQEVTPMTSTSWNLDAYQSIAWVFLYSSMIDGFERISLIQATLDKTNPYYEAVQANFVAKWQAILYDIARDVHIFGVSNVQDVIAEIRRHIKPPDATNTNYEKNALGSLGDVVGSAAQVDRDLSKQDFYAQLRGYMPDFGIGQLELLNGRVTSRLERLRYLVNSVGFEAYQDVDGAIIIKTPLYNLDVMNLDNEGAYAVGTVDPSLNDMTVTNNPFVVQLSEIITEVETEDEAAVRATRITARGNWDPAFQWGGPKEMQATAEDIDVALLSQFGFRTEPTKDAHWFQEGDTKALYAFTASELARANRGLRTYNITIPMRPEIKLGFPMYIPHMDMYGYINTVSMNWTRGSAATTTVSLDSLRRRPLFPEAQTNYNPISQRNEQKVFMTPQENLILRWTSPEEKPASGAKNSNSPASLEGNLATLPFPQQLIGTQAQQIIDARQKGGLDYGINSDTPVNCWRVQYEKKDDAKSLRFDYERPLDKDYYNALQSRRPYTDQKGYETVGPFPWGRWKSLKEALTTFTISDSLGAGAVGVVNPVIAPLATEPLTVTNTSAFLFTGDAILPDFDPVSDISKQLTKQAKNLVNYKVFELSYDPMTAAASQSDTSNSQNGLPSALTASAPPSTTPDPNQDAENRAATLLSGTATTQSFSESILASIPVTSSTTGTDLPASSGLGTPIDFFITDSQF